MNLILKWGRTLNRNHQWLDTYEPFEITLCFRLHRNKKQSSILEGSATKHRRERKKKWVFFRIKLLKSEANMWEEQNGKKKDRKFRKSCPTEEWSDYVFGIFAVSSLDTSLHCAHINHSPTVYTSDAQISIRNAKFKKKKNGYEKATMEPRPTMQKKYTTNINNNESNKSAWAMRALNIELFKIERCVCV